MKELTLITPTFIFSAISLIFLAYTNRFLSYAALVRELKNRYMVEPTAITRGQINNLQKRLKLIKRMQVFGIVSLLLCVATMFLIYIDYQVVAVYVFGVALVCLIISLAYSIWEIMISAKALEIYLSDMHTVKEGEK
ncbi:conserved membrane hypothetical protein [uncultured Paludibacter sp.]|nr:conserved membrane hypothetical protein [uncultured Paludibacter sp.]